VVSEGERVLRGGEMEDLYAAVVKIKEKSRAMSDKLLNGEMEIVWEEAYKGNLYSSMNMSSLIVSTAKSHDLIQKALSHGILAVSAEDDFLVFLTRSKKDRANTLRKTCVSGVKYFANTLNEGVRVLEKPRRVYKVNEFLTLDGSEGYKIFSD
jgi:shikimate kinase